MGDSRFFLVPNQREREGDISCINSNSIISLCKCVWISYLVLKTQVITRGVLISFSKFQSPFLLINLVYLSTCS
jgi:hypothetical protein